jgi:hypothetical protein
VIARLSGPIDLLVARSIARTRDGGLIELFVSAAEARTGGTAAIRVPLTVPCPTCGGVAAPGSVWCRRCTFAGTVVEEITLCIPIPPAVADGTTFGVTVDATGSLPDLAVRIRL